MRKIIQKSKSGHNLTVKCKDNVICTAFWEVV